MEDFKTSSFFVFLFFYQLVSAQTSKATLHGYVRDAANGEELIGVTVYFPDLQKGVVTNAYGFYSITVEGEPIILLIVT